MNPAALEFLFAQIERKHNLESAKWATILLRSGHRIQNVKKAAMVSSADAPLVSFETDTPSEPLAFVDPAAIEGLLIQRTKI